MVGFVRLRVKALEVEFPPSLIVGRDMRDDPPRELEAELLVIVWDLMEVEVVLNRRFLLLPGGVVDCLVPPCSVVRVDLVVFVCFVHLNKIKMIKLIGDYA